MTFSSGIYGSWEEGQKEKISKIFSFLGGEFLQPFRGKTALDIGAGSGYLSEFLGKSGIRVIAIEPDRTMIKNKKDLLLARGEQMPFRRNSFDMLVAIDSIHLIKNEDFLDCLKPGGLVIASLFFNGENFEEKKGQIWGRLKNFEVQHAFSIMARESEVVVVAKKPE
jgi:SAM-dependent methyltransferase